MFHLDVNTGLNGQNVNCIFKDSHGIIWLGTDAGVTCLLGDKIVNFRADSIADVVDVTDIEETEDGKIFVGFSNGGLYEVHFATQQIRRIVPSLINTVKEMTVLQGRLYIKTDKGIYHYENGQAAVLNKYADNGVEWSKVMQAFARKRSRVSPNYDEIDQNKLYSYLRDEQLGIDWYGYFLKGVAHTYPNRSLFETYRFGSVDTRNLDVRSFCLYGADLLIGMRDGFYHINESKGLLRHYLPSEVGASVITNIKWVNDRFLIACYAGGLRFYDPEKQILSETIMPDISFSSLCLDSLNSLVFAASESGIFVFDYQLNLKASYNHNNTSLPQDYYPDVCIDDKGKVWISSLNDMYILDHTDGYVQCDGFPDGFFNEQNNLAFTMLQSQMLAFSPNALFYSTTELDRFGKLDFGVGGIDFVTTVQDSLLLIGTSHGLFLVSRHGDHCSILSHYGLEYGIPSLLFNKKEVAYDDNGTLWMANCQGLVKLSKESQSHLRDSVKAKCFISNLIIDDKLKNDGALLQIVRDKSFTILWNVFSEHPQVTPGILNYAHGAEEFFECSIDDQNFMVLSNRQGYDINSLSLGSHRLRLQLSGHPETAVEYTISVVPSLWVWFELAFILLLAIVIYLQYDLYKRRKMMTLKLRRKHALERLIVARQTSDNIHREEEIRRREEAERN